MTLSVGQARKGLRRAKQAAAARPAAGNVSTHAVTMLRAMPQRTADTRRVAPEPMIADVITWVVETGACHRNAVAYSTEAPTDSAAKACGGSRWMILRPSVRMMRQPPEYVPSEIAVADVAMTQSGSCSVSAGR